MSHTRTGWLKRYVNKIMYEKNGSLKVGFGQHYDFYGNNKKITEIEVLRFSNEMEKIVNKIAVYFQTEDRNFKSLKNDLTQMGIKYREFKNIIQVTDDDLNFNKTPSTNCFSLFKKDLIQLSLTSLEYLGFKAKTDFSKMPLIKFLDLIHKIEPIENIYGQITQDLQLITKKTLQQAVAEAATGEAFANDDEKFTYGLPREMGRFIGSFLAENASAMVRLNKATAQAGKNALDNLINKKQP